MTVKHQGHEQQVILARGLPGSGKSTWFHEVRGSGSCYRYISRDDLRTMLVGKAWNPKKEKAVIDARDALLRQFLGQGYCVILDETFLNPDMLQHVFNIKAEFPHVAWNQKDFTNVDVDECVKRDINRGDRAVGAGVIRELAKKLRPDPPLYEQGLPEVIICDLDGTLALFGDRNPYDRPFENDEPNTQVVNLVRLMAAYARIVITSGRKEKYRTVTQQWLKVHDIPYHLLLMRPNDRLDVKDSLLKRGWYESTLSKMYNVLLVLDDRDQVVDMWRGLGLTCLQVDYGGF